MSFVIDESLLEEIKSRADIVEVISQYVQLKRSGSNYIGLCPFHNEKTPSFSVSSSKELFKCFGCGEGGDVISFIMKKDNVDFPEAIKFLAEKYNIPLREKEYIDTRINEKKERLYKANKLAARFFMETLFNSKYAYNYLQSRGIPHNIIIKYGIGFADGKGDSLLNFLISNGYTNEELLEYNLASYNEDRKSYFDRFRNRIIFPIIDRKSRVIAFGGRVLADGLPKYLNSSDTLVFNKSKNLYGINIIAKESAKDKIILVEGYMDVISLYKHGINYTVASLGTAVTKEQARLMKRYGKEIFLCYDGDQAGIKATDRAIDIMLIEDIKPLIISLPQGMDPDDYIEKYGSIAFEALLTQAKNYLDFKIENAKNNFNINNTQGLTGFIIEATNILSKIKSPVEQDIYIDKISKEYGISKESLIKQIRKNKYTVEKPAKSNNLNQVYKKNNLENKPQDMLLKYSMEELDCYKYINTKIDRSIFNTKEALELYDALLEYYNTKTQSTMEQFVLDKIRLGQLKEDYIQDLSEISVDIMNSKQIINELISKIEISNIEREQSYILAEIRELDKKIIKEESDNIKMLTLIEKLTKINDKLNSVSKEGVRV